MQKKPAAGRSRLADLAAPKLAAVSITNHFRTLAKLELFDEDARAGVLERSRELLRRFGVDWEPDDIDRRDADAILDGGKS